MADKKDNNECPHGPSWPFGVGLALVIFVFGGMADPKLGPLHDMVTRPEPAFRQEATSAPLVTYEDRWVEVDTNPRTEEVDFDPRDLGNLKFQLAPDGNLSQAVTFSEYKAAQVEGLHTSFWIRIHPNQGVATAQMTLIRKPKAH